MSGWSAPAVPLGNIRAEEASGAKNDRGGLLELLDLVIEGDTLVVTHIDRLSRGLTYGLQVIEDLHLRGVEFRSLAEDFDTATASGKLQLTMVLALLGVVAEFHQGTVHRRSAQGKGRGTFPRAAHRPDRTAEGVCPGRTGQGGQPVGAGQDPGGEPVEDSAGGRRGVWA